MMRWILLVDDDADFREGILELFTVEGLSAVAIDGGVSALRLLRERRMEPPSLIILDMRMPDLCGLRFLERLNKELPEIAANVPVILCTASSPSATEAVKAKGRQVMHKPVDIEEIVGQARKALDKPEETWSQPAS